MLIFNLVFIFLNFIRTLHIFPCLSPGLEETTEGGLKLQGTGWGSGRRSCINGGVLRACLDGGGLRHQDPGQTPENLPEAGWEAP